MGRGKARSVLLTELGTKVYAVLMNSYFLSDGKELTSYQVAKEVYEGRTLLSPQKVYDTIKRMEKEGLVKHRAAKLGKKERTLYSVDFEGLARAFNQLYLPQEHRLNEKELKPFAGFLSKLQFFIAKDPRDYEPDMVVFGNEFNATDLTFFEMLCIYIYNVLAVEKHMNKPVRSELHEEVAAFEKLPASVKEKVVFIQIPGIQRAAVESLLMHFFS